MTSTQHVLPQPLVSVYNACYEFSSWAKLVIYRWRNTVGMVSPNSFPAVSSSCNLGGAEKWQRSACKVSTFAAMPHICMGQCPQTTAGTTGYLTIHFELQVHLQCLMAGCCSCLYPLRDWFSSLQWTTKYIGLLKRNCSNSLTCSVHSVTSDTFVHIPAWSKRWQEVNHFSMGGAS